ncbi:MAG: ABC transporter ATP-binding protein [Thermodesulfovibrionales bacterium]|nr:ABC transporter ATP-binding protein [Thermodesulfovibrionales bacterium]
MLLEVRNLTVYYGTVQALNNISLHVNEGEIIAMIGPNGCGKSTALNAICGVLKSLGGEIKSGEIVFEGETINGMLPHELVKKGLCIVPEGRRIFPTMTVMENLEMGGYTANDKRTIKETMEKVFQLFHVLKERRKQKAGTLSSGEQQMLAIGRALMLQPKLLLLDEPSLGLSPNYIEAVFEKIKEINKNGTSILLVEQNAQVALETCHRGYVFEIGSIALEGEKEILLKNERMKRLFLEGEKS